MWGACHLQSCITASFGSYNQLLREHVKKKKIIKQTNLSKIYILFPLHDTILTTKIILFLHLRLKSASLSFL